MGREDRKHLVMVVMVRCTGAEEWAAVTLALGHGTVVMVRCPEAEQLALVTLALGHGHHGKMPKGRGMGRCNISAWSWPSW